MKTAIKYILLSCLIALILPGCTRPDYQEEIEATIPVTLAIANEITARAIGDPVHSVNRILVLPFQKINPALPGNAPSNFTPVYSLARQWDVATFPSGNLTLKLVKGLTYQVMVIGYNANDYNFNTPNAAGNRFSIGSVTTPTLLNNFHLYPKAPNIIPEFFSCFCTASDNGTSLGTIFTPNTNTNISLSGQLNRLVSGLNIQISNIPTYVKSISLTAERMVKAIRVVDTIASLVQTVGDGESRLIQKLTPSNGQILFSNLLLPTMDTYKTKLYLNVSYGQTTETYTIKVQDTNISSGNSISLKPNHVITITGDYMKINLGFKLTYTINLDDNKWDGLQ